MGLGNIFYNIVVLISSNVIVLIKKVVMLLHEKNGLHFLLLLDTSGSMYGEKMLSLKKAAENLLEGLRDANITPEPLAALMTYGGTPKLCVPFSPVSSFELPELKPWGASALTDALALTQAIIKQETTLILISDGRPDDNNYVKKIMDMPLITYIVAVETGPDADTNMLELFCAGRGQVVPAYSTEFMGDYLIQKEWYRGEHLRR